MFGVGNLERRSYEAVKISYAFIAVLTRSPGVIEGQTEKR